MMTVYNTSSLNDKYKVYVQKFNKIATKAGRFDESPMGIDKFAKSYGIMYEETRTQKMNAMKVIDKLVKNDLEYVTWKQAGAVNLKEAGFTYYQVRYGREFWDMIEEKYTRTRDMKKIRKTYFSSK